MEEKKKERKKLLTSDVNVLNNVKDVVLVDLALFLGIQNVIDGAF